MTISGRDLGMATDGRFGMGWMRDLPDVRDLTPKSDEIKPLLAKIGVTEASVSSIPGSVDLRQWCSPIEDQGQLGSCTAHAGVGLFELFERKSLGNHVDASRLFLYKTTRNLLNLAGDTGAQLRSAMAAMVLFGVPPEKYWQYDISKFDVEPSAFLYSFGDSFRTAKYYRYDPPGTPRKALLNEIKVHLASGLPSMFGFTVYDSIRQAGTTGLIPFPGKGDKVVGGHAIDAVGYDDTKVIKNSATGSSTTGALLIRNSWGRRIPACRPR